MVEGVGVAPAEVLTSSPEDRDRDRWLQRTLGGVGEQLARVRDRVLNAAEVQRHHLVLDVNAGSGLLTWDLLRRAPEGGVWTLARDAQAGKALGEQTERLPDLQRPTVLVGATSELGSLLSARGDADVRFDAVVGRGALLYETDKGAAARALYSVSRGGGRLCLAEPVPRHSQRLHKLLDLSALGSDLAGRLAEAEESIYASADDPLVNWESDDLRRWLEEAGFVGVLVDVVPQMAMVHVGAALLDRWFHVGRQGRDSYAAHLLQRLSPDELTLVKGLFQRRAAKPICRLAIAPSVRRREARMISPQRIYDVSVRLHEGIPIFPGDPGVELGLALQLANGDGANVTRVCFGIHSGTHVDAPYHVDAGWPRFSEAFLSTLIGPVRVLEMASSVAIDVVDLEPVDWVGVERVLFKTRNSALWADDHFHEDFVHLTEDGARFLAERTGVRLVGIDYLSIERFHGDLSVHRALLGRGVLIGEGFDLSGVPAGDYQLMCLPLKTTAPDGAPVRAVLFDR